MWTASIPVGYFVILVLVCTVLMGAASMVVSVYRRSLAECRIALGDWGVFGDDSRTRLESLEQRLEDSERRRLEVVTIIEAAQQERDRWRDLYYLEAVEHGNAQQALMAERESLVLQIKQAGKAPRTSAAIDLAVAHHRAEFMEKVPPGEYDRVKGKPAPASEAR